jgi:hypothetical protein
MAQVSKHLKSATFMVMMGYGGEPLKLNQKSFGGGSKFQTPERAMFEY